MSKISIPVILSAAAVAAALFGTLAPAQARPLNACQVRHSQCSERCIMNNTGDGMWSCISRTCDKQSPGCGSEKYYRGGGRRGLVAPAKSGPIVPGQYSPRGPIMTAPIERGGRQPGPIASGPQSPQGRTAPIERGGRR
jgi:hypothetical protein